MPLKQLPAIIQSTKRAKKAQTYWMSAYRIARSTSGIKRTQAKQYQNKVFNCSNETDRSMKLMVRQWEWLMEAAVSHTYSKGINCPIMNSTEDWLRRSRSWLTLARAGRLSICREQPMETMCSKSWLPSPPQEASMKVKFCRVLNGGKFSRASNIRLRKACRSSPRSSLQNFQNIMDKKARFRRWQSSMLEKIHDSSLLWSCWRLISYDKIKIRIHRGDISQLLVLKRKWTPVWVPIKE